jgi:2-methylisocitrate lyase-like PEP mutase family enzyme
VGQRRPIATEKGRGNVALALETGIAGLSIEDRTGRTLYEQPRAVDRIKAAHEAIERSGHDVMLVGRSEGYLIGRTELAATIDRLVAYAEAGADCLYAPGMTDLSAIRALVSAVAPKPVNILLIGPNMRVADLAAAGVRRVSVGGALAAAAWSAFDRAVQLLIDEGMLPKRE